MANHSINQFSSRLVVELKSGRSKVLRSTGSVTANDIHGSHTISYYSLPARHGEQRFLDEILASDIRAIRLETRPYEWVEFKDIALEHK